MSDYNDYYEQCSFYGGSHHYPGYMYGYQDYYATQGRGLGEPLRELDQEQGGVDEPESIQFDDSEEAASDLEGESQPSGAELATSTTQQLSINLINPQRKSEGSIKKLRNVSLTTLSELKEHVCSCLKIPDNDHRQFELGYYERLDTPLRLDLGDTLELTCRNISNLFIQTDRIQYDSCNASAGSGAFVYNGFCFSGSSLRLTLRENSQDLDNTVNFENNRVYFLTSYSEGSFRANDNTFTSGGQCEDGLKMIFAIGQAPEPPVDGSSDDSGGNQDGDTGQPPPDNEGLNIKSSGTTGVTDAHTVNTKSSGTTGVNFYIIIGAAAGHGKNLGYSNVSHAGGVSLVACVCIVIIMILCAKKGYSSTPFLNHTLSSTMVTLTHLFKGTGTSDGALSASDKGDLLYDDIDEARVN